jgi:hypothetical protein
MQARKCCLTSHRMNINSSPQEGSARRSARRMIVQMLMMSVSMAPVACFSQSAVPAVSSQNEFQISVQNGKEPVCNAYAKRLKQTPLRRQLDETGGRWLNNPHCDRGESAFPRGFKLLERVPLSIAEVTRLRPQVVAFLRSPTGSPSVIAKPDPTPTDPAPGTAQFRQAMAMNAGDHFYFYRFRPKVDIDNDGQVDDVIVWKEWGGLCGEPDEGGNPVVLRTDVVVLNERGDLDMMKTRQIFAHPKGPLMVIQDPDDLSHPSYLMDTEFRSIGKTLGVFVYAGKTYFDTFYEVGGDLENQRDGAPNNLDTLAVLQNHNGFTRLVCELLVK